MTAAPAGSAPPAILVRGSDQSLADSAARAAIARLTGGEATSLAVEDHRCGDADIAAVIDAVQTSPFLTDHRIVVLRDVAQLSADEVARLCTYLSDPLDTSTLVLVGGGGTVSTKLDKAVKACGGQVVDSSVPSGAKPKSEWLASKVSDGPVTLDIRARARVAKHFGEDMDRLEGLLATLASAYGEAAKVSEEELEPFLGIAGDVPPWDLTDAIDSGDTASSLAALSRMMTSGDRHALAVMSTLHRHYAAMLALDGSGARTDEEAAKIIGTKVAFVAGKARAQAGRLGNEKIARAITLLADADLDLRGMTGWPPELIMEVLVARLSKLVPARVPAGRRR